MTEGGSMSLDLSHLRENYTKDGLDVNNLEKNPFGQFEKWFREALDAKQPEPNAMIIATVDSNGQPWTRTVLLKHFDEKGFVFYTNYNSNKSRQLEQNSKISLMFLWLELERQIIINGIAEKVSTMESMTYFMKRPFSSQLGAWVSSQSSVITSRKILEMKLDEMKRKFAEGKVPLPDFWGGFRVIPQRFEFWQGRPSRLHDRFQFLKEGNDWTIERLAP